MEQYRQTINEQKDEIERLNGKVDALQVMQDENMEHDGIQSVLLKLDKEFTKFKQEYNEGGLENIMNETPQKLLDKQSSLNKELIIHKQCIDGIVISSKSFGKYLQDIDKVIDKIVTPNIAEYKQWNIETIMRWIGQLENGRFNKYIDILRNGFNKSEINGEGLAELTRSDLTSPPFNIWNLRIKWILKSILNH